MNIGDNKYFHYIDCPVCGSNESSLYLSIKYGELMQKPSLDYSVIGIDADTVIDVRKCIGCGFVFVNPRIRKEYENLVYNASKKNMYSMKEHLKDGVGEKFLIHGRTNRISYFRILSEMLDHVDASGHLTLLDYGCGFGHSMSIARILGIEAYGTDIDETRLKMCREQGLLVSAPGDFDNAYKDVAADIVLWQSNIEHVSDPAGCAEFIRRHCRKGAVMFVNTVTPALIPIERKRGVYDKAHFVEHINYFSVGTLDRFLSSFGFSPISLSNPAVTLGKSNLLKEMVRPLLHKSTWFRTRNGYCERLYRYLG